MDAVSDSTPLIHLAKIGKINYLRSIFKKIFIPQEIYNEIIVKGKEQSKKEVAVIEELINNGFIVMKETSSKMEMPSLHLGELKAISLCRELKIKNFLIDEKEGYGAAEIFGLNPIRTTSLLLILLDKKFINYEEFEESLKDFSSFFIS